MAAKVPPLEDVPEILEKLKKMEQIKNNARENKFPPPEVQDKKDRVNPQTSSQKSTLGFCGMKKGFLFSKSAKGKKGGCTISFTSICRKSSKEGKQQTDEEMPMIRARPEKSSLVLKDVQEVMDVNHALEFQDKVAQRLEANPHVQDVISDPAWIPILDEFQQDPEAALRKYKDDAEIINTLKELCSVLGDTFLHMNSEIQSEEELFSSKYMEDACVREALTDPLVQQMMVYMKQGANDQVQRCFQSANPSQKRNIQTLIDVGLFAFSM